jgi:Winged helix-turn-helix DNA-binding
MTRGETTYCQGPLGYADGLECGNAASETLRVFDQTFQVCETCAECHRRGVAARLERTRNCRAPIVELLKNDPDLTYRDLSDRTGLSHGTVSQYANDARRAGELPRRRMRPSR